MTVYSNLCYTDGRVFVTYGVRRVLCISYNTGKSALPDIYA